MSQKSNFISLVKKLNDISMLFFYAKRRTALKDEDNKYLDLINKINACYQLLDDEDKLFINNEFFFEQYSYWWIDSYSRSTFYRHKKKAMKNFLRIYRCLQK